MLDPRKTTGMSGYDQEIRYHQGCLKVPKNMNPAELEWEYYVSKLHWNYSRASEKDLETLKKLAERL